jgi:hypothetical protein
MVFVGMGLVSKAGDRRTEKGGGRFGMLEKWGIRSKAVQPAGLEEKRKKSGLAEAWRSSKPAPVSTISMPNYYAGIFIAGVLLVLQGCNRNPIESQQPSDFRQPSDSQQTSTWYDNAEVEAINKPDSTVQLFVDTLPVLCSWRISRVVGGAPHLIKHVWGQCYHDSCPSPGEPVDYRIVLLDDNGDSVREIPISSAPWVNKTRVGLIYPDSGTKLVEGERIPVIWNPESFPDSFVEITYDASVTVRNTGRYLTDFYSVNRFESIIISDSVNSAYRYSQFYCRGYVSLSEIVTSPGFKDTVRIGLATPLSWKTNAFSNPIQINLVDEQYNDVAFVGYRDNSGEFAWIVPNVAPGIYYLRLTEDATYLWHYSLPFFIAR